jgi:hypothetical protein
MEELENVKSIQKVELKKGAKYLFVFKTDRQLPLEASQDIKEGIKRLAKRFDVDAEGILLEGGMTLDIVEKEKVEDDECSCHCHSEKDLPDGVRCKCIKNCKHCRPENFIKKPSSETYPSPYEPLPPPEPDRIKRPE